MAKDPKNSTQLTQPEGSNLVIDTDFAQALLQGLTASRVTLQAPGGGKPFLRLLRDGDWVFGQGDDLVQEGSHWAINVKTLYWGWVCWTNRPSGQKNEKLGQVMDSMIRDRPAKPDPIQGYPFADQISFDALCLDGEDAGLEVTFSNGSIGTMRAFTKLRDAIIVQLQKDIRYPCPVITLGQESYKHTSYGKIYNPIWTITGWADLGGNLAPTGTSPAPTASPEPVPASPAAPAEPARKRKAPLGDNGAPAAEAAPAPAEPAPGPTPTQQVHTGQRRRHRPAA